MLSYCLKCRKNAQRKNPKVARTKNGRKMLLWTYAVYDGKKIIKEQESSGLLSSLKNKDPFKKNSLIKSCFVLIVLDKLIQGIKWMK